jgi:hypothetical protein
MIIEHASPFFPAEAQGRKDSKKGNDLAVYIYMPLQCFASLAAWRETAVVDLVLCVENGSGMNSVPLRSRCPGGERGISRTVLTKKRFAG